MRVRTLALALALASSVLVVPGQPASAATSPSPHPSWSAAVGAIYRDLIGRNPTATQRSSAVTALSSGAKSPAALVVELRGSSDNLGNVDPVTRLYRAVYRRIPDAGGLNYWVKRRRSGGWTVVRIADFFSKAPEFTSTYGQLSNRDYVKLIYRNVLERPYDAGGLDYWTKSLDAKRRTRGAVMANFSESSEYVRTQSSEVSVTTLHVLLLGRAPTASEFASGTASLDGATTLEAYVASILTGAEYAARVPLSGVQQVSVGGSRNGASTGTACAIVGAGAVRCWGANTVGQVGDGTQVDRPLPTAVVGISDATAVSVGPSQACALRAGGTVSCWGADSKFVGGSSPYVMNSPTPSAVPGIRGATEIASQGYSACALIADGTISCWGGDHLGDGKTSSVRRAPVKVKGISTATSISAGMFHTCALLAGGTVRCWGDNHAGQVGDRTEVDRPTPVAVYGVSGALEVASGGDGSCALLTGGRIVCWGATGLSVADFVPADGYDDVTQITMGDSLTCLARRGGTVTCAGVNEEGQAGNGTKTGWAREGPVSGLGGVVAMDSASDSTCVVLADTTVRCWGWNQYGQLGDESTTSRATPVRVLRG